MAGGAKRVCRYDGNCYRKNPDHFQEFRHPVQCPEADPDRPGTAVGTAVDAASSPPTASATFPRTETGVPAALSPGQVGAPDPAWGLADAAVGESVPRGDGTASPSPSKRPRCERPPCGPSPGLTDGQPPSLQPRLLSPPGPGVGRAGEGGTPGSRCGAGGRRPSPPTSPTSRTAQAAQEETGTHPTSATDEYTDSFTSTAPTEVVRELSSPSSFGGGQARRTPPMVGPVPWWAPPLQGAVRHEPAFPLQPPWTLPVPGAAMRRGQPSPPSLRVHARADEAQGEDRSRGQGGLGGSAPRCGDEEGAEGEAVWHGSQRDGASGRQSTARSMEAAARELQEGPPTAELLAHLLLQDPIRSCVDMSDDDGGDECARVVGGPPGSSAAAALYPGFARVDAFLYEAYSLTPTPGDARVVLLAAVRLNPTDPLNAFPGWRLVGPLELAWRAFQYDQQQQQQWRKRSPAPSGDHDSPSAPPPPSRQARSYFRSEAAAWRCARFRHDPPECQTVAISTSAGDGERQHLCYFRDDPAEAPSMLVAGTEASSTFRVVGTTLTAYLRATADVARSAEVREALAAALAAVVAGAEVEAGAVTAALGLRSDGSAPSLTAQRSASEQQRKRSQLASTFHGLGIRAPYDEDTDLGYRPPTLTQSRLRTILQSWDRDWATKVWRIVHASPDGSAGADGRIGPTIRSLLTSMSPPTPADKPFAASYWEDIHEQFRYADMANDEGDAGLTLELGMNFFALIVAPSLPLAPDGVCMTGREQLSARDAASITEGQGEEEAEQAPQPLQCSPLLWHAFRLLDCAYMLLNRPLYRHVLRCHLPVLAGIRPPLLDGGDVFVD